MKLLTALKLGRISNLPTVWTNVLAGSGLLSITIDNRTMLMIAVAISFLYLAGMYLNDVFDLEWDRQHQIDRPLVRGDARLSEVIWLNLVFLIAATIILLLAAEPKRMPISLLGTTALIACIVLYDWKHKTWGFSPWIMGACRLLVYLMPAVIIGSWNLQLLIAALCLLGYIAGITYLARAEHMNSIQSYLPIALLFLPLAFVLYLGINNPIAYLLVAALAIWLIAAIKRLMPGKNRQIPQAISALLAGITLIDASILQSLQHYCLALFSLGAFVLCLVMQRKIPAS